MAIAEGGTAQWAGTQIQARDYYYFYKGMSESLEQERAQLSQLQEIMDPTMFKFAVGTKFGGTMGAKWEMKQPHLVEIAKLVRRLQAIERITVKNGDGIPDEEHPHGMQLMLPKLKRLHLLYSVLAFRAYNEPTIRKWMEPPEDQVKKSRFSGISQLLKEADE